MVPPISNRCARQLPVAAVQQRERDTERWSLAFVRNLMALREYLCFNREPILASMLLVILGQPGTSVMDFGA